MFYVRLKYSEEELQVYAVSNSKDENGTVKTWFLFYDYEGWDWRESRHYEPIT